MNDIIPPKRPLNPKAASYRPRPTATPQNTTPRSPESPSVSPLKPNIQPVQQQKTASVPSSRPLSSHKRSLKKWLWWLGGSVIAVLLIAIGSVLAWYTLALQPVNAEDTNKVSVQIVEGSSPGDIGRLLQEQKLIRSSLAFEIYVRVEGVRGQLQAGTYSLSPSESTQEIVSHLTSGKVDMVTVTFLPGATLAENRKVLLDAGFDETEVDTALQKQYDSPLLADKPAGSDLEGYIYGETYTFDASVTVEEILERTFTEYWQVIQQNNIVAGFQAQNLNLFEGITLASIVQREDSNPANQANIARIFLNRLELGMPLGSDVTYYYGAAKLGVEPSSDLESPYNTRLHTGLPPGPISSPGLSALEAVARPAQNDYLYFISGDDDVLYMAMTNEEHEANVAQYCQVKCQLP